jgi:nucleoside-diphosphate-sugar epimerase
MIGSAVVKRLLADGMAVVAVDVNAATRPVFDAMGVGFVHADVTQEAQVIRLAGEAGPVDSVVHVAGGAGLVREPSLETSTLET